MQHPTNTTDIHKNNDIQATSKC